MCFKKFVEPSKEYLYFIFRVIVGGMFAFHGAQKLAYFQSFVGIWPIFGSSVVGTLVAYAELLIG